MKFIVVVIGFILLMVIVRIGQVNIQINEIQELLSDCVTVPLMKNSQKYGNQALREEEYLQREPISM